MDERVPNPDPSDLAKVWEDVLAAQGLPAELKNGPEVPSGDALKVAEPDSADERKDLAAREETGDLLYDSL